MKRYNQVILIKNRYCRFFYFPIFPRDDVSCISRISNCRVFGWFDSTTIFFAFTSPYSCCDHITFIQITPEIKVPVAFFNGFTSRIGSTVCGCHLNVFIRNTIYRKFNIIICRVLITFILETIPIKVRIFLGQVIECGWLNRVFNPGIFNSITCHRSNNFTSES